ncbi:MAG: hypothetical protein ACK4P4_00530 [Allorhizobium sp.]
MRTTLGMILLSSVVTLAMSIPASAGGLSIGGSKGISVDVNTSDGLGVDASVGGSRGVNASANVNGSRGLSADVDAGVGGEGGLNASVGARIGGSSGTGIDIDVGLGRDPNVGNGPASGGPGSGGLTAPQRQALRDMSASERQRLLKRCGSINSAAYDPSLVELCRLLRLSASR